MATIYQIVDTQVYTKQQVQDRCAVLNDEQTDWRAVFKQQKGKWYVTVSSDAPFEFPSNVNASVQTIFRYSYMTSGGPASRTFRVGSTAKRTAEQIAKEKTTRRSHTLRTALFDALWSKFNKDDVDLDVDYVSDIVDVITAAVTKHNTK